MAQFVVGLTGLIGSGKSAAAQCFRGLGVDIIDTDVIAHMVTAKGAVALSLIEKHFGAEFIVDGELQRHLMRRLVFSDAKAKQMLEGILHPLIFAEVLRQLEVSHSLYTIVVVPLLFKAKNYLQLIKRSIVVDCEAEILIARVIERTGLTQPEVDVILKAQVPRIQQLALADDVIENNNGLEQLQAQVVKLDTKYRKLIYDDI